MSSFVGIPLYFLQFFLILTFSLIFINKKIKLIVYLTVMKKSGVNALMKHQVCLFWAIGN